MMKNISQMKMDAEKITENWTKRILHKGRWSSSPSTLSPALSSSSNISSMLLLIILLLLLGQVDVFNSTRIHRDRNHITNISNIYYNNNNNNINNNNNSNNNYNNNKTLQNILLWDSKMEAEQITAKNPCLVHYCPKGKECILNKENNNNKPICICQRNCPQRKHHPICGSDGKIYDNHCELHRVSCLLNYQITYQRIEKCNNFNMKRKNLMNKQTKEKYQEMNKYQNENENINLKNSHSLRLQNGMEKKQSEEEFSIYSATTIIKDQEKYPYQEGNIINNNNNNYNNNNNSDNIEIKMNFSAISIIENNNNMMMKINNLNVNLNDNVKNIKTKLILSKSSSCSSQEYEIMKDNLLLYSHARLLISQDNNHSKDFLVSIMFSHYDQNNDAHLEIDELNQISNDEHLEELSNGCALYDMINFDDLNKDGKLNINEFYQAFSKLYSVSVVSLDKALEINHLSARIGDNVEIKCDVTGSPSPPIIWKRYGIDLSLLNMEDEIRIFNDGSLYLTKIQLLDSGNYTCHAQGNKDVVQTHVLRVYTIPEVQILPKIQSKRPHENAEMFCHVSGDPLPEIQWLKNDEFLHSQQLKKFEIRGNGTLLRINNIEYSDTGAYMCQARNIGGQIREISSLIVQEFPTPTMIHENKKFFTFHEDGISIYESLSCRLYHEIKGNDLITGLINGINKKYICGDKNIKCIWGQIEKVDSNFIYISQPTLDRILILSSIQMLIVDLIETDKYPVELYYMPRLDQIWILNWHIKNENEMMIMKTIQVIRSASKNKKHHTVHPEPIHGQFDLIKNFFLPSNELEENHHHYYRYGYVTHTNQRGLYKLDLTYLRYVKNVDLTLYNCVPEYVEFSALYGFVIISCREPITHRSQGQLLMDYLTDAILSIKLTINGKPKVSPDSKHVVTIEHRLNGVLIVVQKITSNGLEFLFDVKTSLNISDITFFKSENSLGYDLWASASDIEDILYLNLRTGKVEMITGIGPAIPNTFIKWNTPVRMIKSSGIFGQFIITSSRNSVFVINGRTRSVNCEITGLNHPLLIAWINSNNNNNHNVNNNNNYLLTDFDDDK